MKNFYVVACVSILAKIRKIAVFAEKLVEQGNAARGGVV